MLSEVRQKQMMGLIHGTHTHIELIHTKNRLVFARVRRWGVGEMGLLLLFCF